MNGEQQTSTPKLKCKSELRLERRQRGLSRKQVAQLVGKSVELIRMYERGDVMPPLRTAFKLAILYRTQLAAIYCGLYQDLTRQMRQAEEQVLARRRSGT